MEWIERLNEAMCYIEAHLDEELDYAQAAAVACCSVYHFQRMFGYMAGMPLSEYIRRRRVSRAATELLGGAKVLDVALRYGYSSPTAFNRAFQSVQGFAPSQLHKPGSTVKSFPPVSFKLTITGVVEMEYRIEQKDAIRIVGISCPLAQDMPQNFEAVPALWGRAAAEGTVEALAARMDGQPKALLGVSMCCGAEADAYRRQATQGTLTAPSPAARVESWRYYLAVPSSLPVPDGMEEAEIPAFTWAVFPGAGVCPQAIQALEKRIVTEWLPTSGYEYANGPDVEAYFTPDPASARFEVWIPVVKQS